MRIVAIGLAAALALAAAAAQSQIGNPAFGTPGAPERARGIPAPHEPNNTDRLFARLLAAGGLAEVEFAKLADKRAQDKRVKEFASRMKADHGKANDQLKALAKEAGIALPAELDLDHRTKLAQLDKTDQFDAEYIASQIVDHQKAVTLLQWELGSGQDLEMQQFAATILPIVTAHLQMIQEIHAEIAMASTHQSQSTSDTSGQQPPRRPNTKDER